jgi:hypothetical protein
MTGYDLFAAIGGTALLLSLALLLWKITSH